MLFDGKNDVYEGRGCNGDTIKVAIATGKIERVKVYNDYGKLGEIEVASEIGVKDLPASVKVAYEAMQAHHIQEMFSAAREVFDEKPKHNGSKYEQTYEESYGSKDSRNNNKRGNSRKAQQQKKAFETQLYNGEHIKTKAERHEETKRENAKKFVQERNARENGDDR